MVTFTVHGEPVGKARPRVVSIGGRSRAYTPQKTKAYEQRVRAAYMAGRTKANPATCPIRLEVNAYFTIPKSASKATQKAMELGMKRPTKKPDADNIGKAIADALNGYAYEDDSQIVEMTVTKWYSDDPRVEVTLESV